MYFGLEKDAVMKSDPYQRLSRTRHLVVLSRLKRLSPIVESGELCKRGAGVKKDSLKSHLTASSAFIILPKDKYNIWTDAGE